ncbi:MAG: deoxyribose-phosphate aldolase [Planctomycetaceae bacterium]|nr:deoxyribose-phosphate aldolase [Planctomycetaceae bacterium]
MTSSDLAGRIQHTLLKITASADDIRRLCRECREYHFQAACIQPMWVDLAAQELAGSATAVCAVADFPHGACTAEAAAFEVRDLVRRGAQEIDVVCKIGYLRSGMDAAFRDDLAAVVGAAQGRVTKVILETSILTPGELARAINLSAEAGMHYIKTASGFNGPGATVEIVREMKRLAAGRVKIKAAGGVRTREDAVAMIEAGADCLGTSSGVAIMQGGTQGAGY